MRTLKARFLYRVKEVKQTENLTPAEKAKAARAYYARQRRRKNPEVREMEKNNRQRYWERYFDSVVKPGLDQKIESAKE